MITINLLPEEYGLRRIRRRANTAVLVLLALTAVGLGAGRVAAARNAQQLKTVWNGANKAYDVAAELMRQMQHYQAIRDGLLAKAERKAALSGSGGLPRSALLAIVANALPEDVSLARLQLGEEDEDSAGSTKATGKRNVPPGTPSQKPPPSTETVLQITGLAVTDVAVARFMGNLNQNGAMGPVTLVYSRETPAEKLVYREFRIKAVVKGAVSQ